MSIIGAHVCPMSHLITYFSMLILIDIIIFGYQETGYAYSDCNNH